MNLDELSAHLVARVDELHAESERLKRLFIVERIRLRRAAAFEALGIHHSLQQIRTGQTDYSNV